MLTPPPNPASRLPSPAVALLAAALLVPTGALDGQSTDDAEEIPVHGADAAVDTRLLDAVSPRERDGASGDEPASSWSTWLTRGAGLGMLVATDVGLRRAVQDLRYGPGPLGRSGSVGDEMVDFGNGLGAWKTSLPYLAAGSVAAGAALDGLRGAGRGLSILGGIAAGTMANAAVNQVVGRSRPIWDEGVLSFDPLSGHASFPSGHVSVAFSVAGGIDAVTDGWLPATAAYTVAGTTAFARVYDDKHWLSDVVVGAALSAAVSRLATRRTMELLGVGRDGSVGEEASPRGGAALADARRAPGDRSVRARLLFTPSLLGVQLRF